MNAPDAARPAVSVEDVLAGERCRDIHESHMRAYERAAGTAIPCDSCRSWGAHVAAALAEAGIGVLAEVPAPFEALFAGGPDTPCRTHWRDAGGDWPDEECVEVPMADLRDAFTAARAAAARVEGQS